MNVEDSTQNIFSCLADADKLACFGFKFDVRITKDNALIVAYDDETQGVVISDSFMSDVRKIVLANGDKIPTLEEFLEKTKNTDIHLILELKEMPEKKEVQSAKVISDMLKQKGLLDRTDIMSLSMHACKQFLYSLPGSDIYYVISDFNPENNYLPEQVKEIGLSGICCEASLLHEHDDWIKKSHKLGLKVNARIIDMEEDISYFIDKGIDFITTDNPETAMNLLKK